MSDIVGFLRARLDEDEQLASYGGPTNSWVARLQAEVESKRQIVSLLTHLDYSEDGQPILLGGYGEAYWDVLRLIALPYADHPGYDPAWRCV